MATLNRMRLKLLGNKSSKKVLFAEAGKEFVDFLFGLLEMPIGCLLMKSGVAGRGFGSLGRVYQSVRNLDCSYLQAGQRTKDTLLNPAPASSNATSTFLLQVPTFDAQYRTGFGFGAAFPQPAPSFGAAGCSTAFGYGANTNNTTGEGYVKGVVSYMVMDNLEVRPMSTISSVTLLNTFDVKDVGCLEEKTVEIDMVKGLELVRASFNSATVLTDVLLPTDRTKFPVSGTSSSSSGFSFGSSATACTSPGSPVSLHAPDFRSPKHVRARSSKPFFYSQTMIRGTPRTRPT